MAGNLKLDPAVGESYKKREVSQTCVVFLCSFNIQCAPIAGAQKTLLHQHSNSCSFGACRNRS